MEIEKKKLQNEKQVQLKDVKERMKLDRPALGGGNSMIGENYDYMLDTENHIPSPEK
jgi:hypothetical protein